MSDSKGMALVIAVSVVVSTVLTSGVMYLLMNSQTMRDLYTGPQGEKGESSISLNQLTEFEQELLYYHLRYRDNLFDYLFDLEPGQCLSGIKKAWNSGFNITLNDRFMARLELREIAPIAQSSFIVDFENEVLMIITFQTKTAPWTGTIYYWSPRGPSV